MDNNQTFNVVTLLIFFILVREVSREANISGQANKYMSIYLYQSKYPSYFNAASKLQKVQTYRCKIKHQHGVKMNSLHFTRRAHQYEDNRLKPNTSVINTTLNEMVRSPDPYSRNVRADFLLLNQHFQGIQFKSEASLRHDLKASSFSGQRQRRPVSTLKSTMLLFSRFYEPYSFICNYNVGYITV